MRVKFAPMLHNIYSSYQKYTCNTKEQKGCKSCGLLKPLDSFRVDYRYQDKRNPECIGCQKKQPNAAVTVQRALSTKVLIRPTQCARCGTVCKPEAHHEDYDNPLHVVWLCRKCHRKLHRKLPARTIYALRRTISIPHWYYCPSFFIVGL